jgi:hypothetical protein
MPDFRPIPELIALLDADDVYGDERREIKLALSALLERNAELERDALRYLAWRDSHAKGMRPFLPEVMPAKGLTTWSYPFDYDPPHDEWMTSSPEQRGRMIDEYIDAALSQEPTRQGEG